MSNKKYTVYIHINKINQKRYIGITSQTVNRRWRKDGQGYKQCKLFYRAIKKTAWGEYHWKKITLEEYYEYQSS